MSTIAEETQELDQVIQHDDADWFLQNLVCNINYNGNELGLTIYVNGLIVSGTLISGKEYFELLADIFSSENVQKESLFTQERDAYSQENVRDAKHTSFLHMKNAKAVDSNGSTIPSNGCLWRGKLNHVSGFNIGELVTSKQ